MGPICCACACVTVETPYIDLRPFPVRSRAISFVSAIDLHTQASLQLSLWHQHYEHTNHSATFTNSLSRHLLIIIALSIRTIAVYNSTALQITEQNSLDCSPLMREKPSTWTQKMASCS